MRFQVGQYVQVAYEENPFGRDGKAIYQVIERQCQECPAGAQHWYSCRGHYKDKFRPRTVSTQLIKFNEIELAEVDEVESRESSGSFRDQITALLMRMDDEIETQAGRKTTAKDQKGGEPMD